MTYTTYAKREELQSFNLPESLAGQVFRVVLVPVSVEDEDEIEFRSLKGSAGIPLTLDEVRAERLHL